MKHETWNIKHKKHKAWRNMKHETRNIKPELGNIKHDKHKAWTIKYEQWKHDIKKHETRNMKMVKINEHTETCERGAKH